MRTIRVTGKGQLKVHPDMTRITITLEGLHKDHGKTLQRSSEDTEKLRQLITGFGFEPTDLKTLMFGVDTEHEGYRENGEYRSRFVGYKYTHMMKIEFESDNKRLGQILYALAHSPLAPEFHISYTIKEPERAKNELLGKAVADAVQKAAILTSSAGVRLKDIQNIDYSWGEIDFEVHPMNRTVDAKICCPTPSPSYDLNIEPDDIAVSDTVTVVWEIE